MMEQHGVIDGAIGWDSIGSPEKGDVEHPVLKTLSDASILKYVSDKCPSFELTSLINEISAALS